MPPTSAQLERYRNTRPSIDQLSVELVTEIFVQGFPDVNLPRAIRWREVLDFLRVIGAVSSRWRKVRDNTTTLWATISYSYFISPKANAAALELLNLFLLRSKVTPLNLMLNFIAPDVADHKYSPISSQIPCIPDILPHVHRCQTLYVKGGGYDVLASMFPLTRSTRALRNLELDLAPRYDHSFKTSLLEPENEVRLKSLKLFTSLCIPHGLKYINTADLTHLEFIELNEDVLRFIAQCESLKFLSIHSVFKSKTLDLSGAPAVYLPHLSCLSVVSRFPYDFTYLFDCPQLTHLEIDEPYSYNVLVVPLRGRFNYPMLRTLVINTYSFGRGDVPDIIQFIQSCDLLEVIKFTREGNVVEVLQSLIKWEDSGKPCPNLAAIHISTSEVVTAAGNNTLFNTVRKLLQQRPALRLRWIGRIPDAQLQELHVLFKERLRHYSSTRDAMGGQGDEIEDLWR